MKFTSAFNLFDTTQNNNRNAEFFTPKKTKKKNNNNIIQHYSGIPLKRTPYKADKL